MKMDTYEEIIKYLNNQNRQLHLLMGNGFSMAYDSKIFSYNALHNFIEELDNELLTKLFSIINTKNFELIMQQLDNFRQIAQTFDANKDFVDKLQNAKSILQTSLIEAVKELHPEHVFKIPDEKSAACAEFISMYLNNSGNVFTTNYDILLYWIIMREQIKVACDGFGRDVEYDELTSEVSEVSELRWGRNKDKQNVHYLHGALPIFDTGVEVIKEEYTNENFLLENIKKRMNVNNYPIFVTAGNGKEKLEHIKHNQYLTTCYDKLSSIQGSLITFGFSFGEFDDHIIDAINLASKNGKKTKDRLLSVYIGVYSQSDIDHIESIRHKFKCKVKLFDAKTVKVWG